MSGRADDFKITHYYHICVFLCINIKINRHNPLGENQIHSEGQAKGLWLGEVVGEKDLGRGVNG